jgi:hypothetical protein
MPWSLLLKEWKVVLVLLILVGAWASASVLYVQRDHARENLAAAQAQISQMHARASEQAANSAEKDAENLANTKSLEAKYENALFQHATMGQLLAGKLRDYQNSLRACTLSSIPAPPGGATSPSGEPGSAERAERRVNDALVALAGAAGRDADRLDLCRAAWPK